LSFSDDRLLLGLVRVRRWRLVVMFRRLDASELFIELAVVASDLGLHEVVEAQ